MVSVGDVVPEVLEVCWEEKNPLFEEVSIFTVGEIDDDGNDDCNGADNDDEGCMLDANARQYRTVECRRYQARKRMDEETIRSLFDCFDDDARSRFFWSINDDGGCLK